MRKVIISFLAGVVLTASGTAVAAQTRILSLRNGDKVLTENGKLFCVYSSNTIACGVFGKPREWLIGINTTLVAISRNGKVVVTRKY